MFKRLMFPLIFLAAFLSAADKPTVTVSIVPLQTFVQKIAGESVETNVMVLPGHSPATYEPKPSQMRALSRSRLYFAVGVPFEKTWLPRFADQNAGMKIIHTQEGLALLEMAAHHHHEAEHDDDEHRDHDAHEDPDDHDEDGHDDHDDEHHEDEAHHHGGKDPHVWLSPANVKVIAATMLDALIGLMPENEKEFRVNYRAFIAEIDATDAALRTLLAPFKGEAFMVFHPSWGYLARDYGLKQLPIEIEGKEPAPSQLSEFIRDARQQRVRAIFVQPEFSKKAATLIAREAGVNVVSVSSLASDWSQNLIAFAKSFKRESR